MASNDWNDALGEYNAPAPGGKIGDGGVLNEWQTDTNKKKKKKKKPIKMIEKFKI